MIRISLAMFGLACALGTTRASAEDAADKKFRVGARLGYAVPRGGLAAGGGGSIHDSVTHQVPIAIDAGYTVLPQLLLGAYGQYGFVTQNERSCPADQDCSANDLSFGVQAQYHPISTRLLDPWIGLGAGYEILTLHASRGGERDSVRLRGFEFAKLQAGLDFRVSNTFALGPFLSYSLGEYSHYKYIREPANPPGTSGEIDGKSMHEWCTVGVKGAFAL